MSWRVSPWIYPVSDSLHFLDLIDYFLSHIREVFNYNLFKYFLCPFPLFSSYPKVELLDCVVVLFLIFWEPSLQFSTVATSIYIPISSAWVFRVIPILANFCFFCLFNDSHYDRCEVVSHGFDLHFPDFPDDKWCWTPFHIPVGHLYVFFRKISIQVLCPFFNEIVWFFLLLSCYWVLYIF